MLKPILWGFLALSLLFCGQTNAGEPKVLLPIGKEKATDGKQPGGGSGAVAPFKSHVAWPDPTSPKFAASLPWKMRSLCKAYNFPTKLKGGGVIAIIELGGGYFQSDLDLFSQLNGLPPIVVTDVSVNGGFNNPGFSGADAEVALDIQVAAAAYYYAVGKMPTIRVYFAPNSLNAFTAVINAVLADKCDVLSISWGLDEKNFQTFAPGTAAAIETSAANAASKGLVMFAAAGDFSSSDGNTGNNTDIPASCPHVIGCGGTNKGFNTEVVWGDGIATDPGTGGGFSSIFPVQSYQIGAPTPPTGLGRMVPDVAANADPNTGYLIVLYGGQVQIGGTSAVAPLYSGLFASLGTKLGFVTPKLWKNPKAFVDITQGSNGGYKALVGPDACSGLGAPDGTAISKLFVTPTAPPPTAVTATYTASPPTLTLTGDVGSSGLTITAQGKKITLSGSSTTINGLSSVSYTINGPFAITGNMGAGNDSVSMVSLQLSTCSLNLGPGNDTLVMNYCTVGTSAVDGGPGTDTFVAITSNITNNNNVNFP